MEFQNHFPVWGKLTDAQQNLISGHLMSQMISKGTVIHNGSMDCTGQLLVKSGQLRPYRLEWKPCPPETKDDFRRNGCFSGFGLFLQH